MTKNNKNTKRALLAGVISMLLCVSMLIGSTFAWFTDFDTTTVANIVSGTLDIEIVDKDGKPKTDELKFVNISGSSDILWEPGAEFRTEEFAFKNVGNLHLKLKVAINNTEVSYNKLNEVIDFTLVDASGNETTLPNDLPVAPEQSTGLYRIKGVMDTGAGNAYQGLTMSGVSITVYATQYTSEIDWEDNQYDADAKYDGKVESVSTADAFLKAVAELENGGIISLTEDVDLTGKTWNPITNKSFTLDGNGKTIRGMNGPLVSRTGALEYTIKDVTFESMTVNSSDDYAGLIAYADTCSYILMENVTIKNSKFTSNDYVGGFAGYTSGYGNDKDGPVNASHNFNNCKIYNTILTSTDDGSVGGLIGHAGSNPATTTRVNGFEYSGLAISQTNVKPEKTGNMIGTANVGVVYITDADFNDKTDIGRFVPSTTGKLVINNVEQTTFENKEADTVVNVEMPKTQDEVTNTLNAITDNTPTTVVLPATTVTLPTLSNKDVTFTGTKDTVIDLSANVGTSGADVTFDGVTVKFDNDDYEGLQHSTQSVYKNCHIIGKQFLYSDTQFINCTFENKNDYCIWTYGASNVTFTNCTFTTGGKAVLVYHEGPKTTTVNLTDCKFYDDGTLDTTKAAVETGDSAGDNNNFTLVFNNCTATGFATNNSSSVLWGNKTSDGGPIPADRLKVTINNTEINISDNLSTAQQ